MLPGTTTAEDGPNDGATTEAPEPEYSPLTSEERFRTDSHPELDFYQPCSGGDNLIHFPINVHDVDLSTVQSATLTLAVWDVDYHCGSACSGHCERDEVYLNGHRLTTPEPYLTGANQQWSTCTFDVDPSWLVDGDNEIRIVIDILGYGCWCVECDWGELILNLEEIDLEVQSNYISISPRSWWQFWRRPFDIKATIHNTGVSPADDVKVKIARTIYGFETESETKTIRQILPDETGSVSVNWYFSFYQNIEVTVDPDDTIEEANEGNNFAKSTITSGKVTNSAGSVLPHLQVTYQEMSGGNWDDKISVFTDIIGNYYISNNLSALTEGRTSRISADMLYSPTDDPGRSKFRLIDEQEWGNGRNPNSRTPASEESGQRIMDKGNDRIENITVGDNNGGIGFHTMVGLYNYHAGGGRAPSGEILIEINDDDRARTNGPYRNGNAIHLSQNFQSARVCPSTLGHEYTHIVEDGWSIDTNHGHDPNFPVEEGSCHWGSCVARGTSIMVYPNSISLNSFVNIDISDDSQTDGNADDPAPSFFRGAREEFQIAGTMWDLQWNNVWATLRHGGFWWWEHPDTPELFYTYYKDRDSRSSPTIKNIFRNHGYQPYTDNWPGKAGQDPAYFTDSYTDYLVDPDADGFADYLAIDVELMIPAAGNHFLNTEIQGLRYGAGAYTYLDAGIQTVTIMIDGQHIYEVEQDGPHTVSFFLADENYDHLDHRLEAYVTLPYSYIEFEKPPILINGILTDYGNDLDSNGLFDELVVEVEVDVSEPRMYEMHATLYEGTVPIDNASTTVDLAAAVQPVSFVFDGVAINASMRNGPYTVSVAAPRGAGLTTGAYNYLDFESPLTSLGSIVSEMGIDADGDGLFDFLQVDIEVIGTVETTCVAMLHLLDDTENHITTLQENVTVIPGSQEVSLYLDGLAIRRSEKDGPYVLEVDLLDSEENLIGQLSEMSSPYSYLDFQVAASQYFDITFHDEGIDEDSNGRYDYLSVEATISSEVRPGDYRLDGYLYDPGNQLIAYALDSVSVISTPHSGRLDFPGHHVWMSRINDASYTLELRMYDTADSILTVALTDIYTTGEYDYTEFESPVAFFDGTWSDYGSDTNSDGRYEALVVEVGVSVQDSGTYELQGRLDDVSSEEIASAAIQEHLDVGTHSMELTFDGPTIYRHRVDGPYQLGFVELTDETSEMVDLARNVHLTDAYGYTEFERPPVLLTGAYSDSAVDVNGDDIYEYLALDVGIIVSNSGNYAMNARLMDQYGDEIVWASTTSWLPADQDRIMRLNFSGPTIYDHGVDSPFHVMDLYVYNTSNVSLSDYVYDACWTTSDWNLSNDPPVADAGPDQTVERTTVAGAEVQLDGSGSYDPDGDPLTYDWVWIGGSASGVSPTVILPPGTTIITLTVSDGEYTDSDTVEINVVDSTPPSVGIVWPLEGMAVQDSVVFGAIANDISGVQAVYFCLREDDGGEGIPVGYEDLSAVWNGSSGNWEYDFDTTILDDGYYLLLARALDTYDNENWSDPVHFSIRNWAVIELLPQSQEFRAGRTVPIKFSLRIVEEVDPLMPFVYNEGLEIRIYDESDPDNILQSSRFGEGARNYRINLASELYITNFKTSKISATYIVEVWRINQEFLVGSFSFETVK
jgi:hypothetical protein